MTTVGWALWSAFILGGSINESIDDATKMRVYTLASGELSATVVPEAGLNVSSIKFRGREILRQAPSLDKLPGFMHGVPLLYPTPNRVRDATFSFGDHVFRFPANNGVHFLHGLVHDAPWKVIATKGDKQMAEIVGALDFEPGAAWYELFPLRHTLRVRVRVTDHAVRWDYEVDNSKGREPVPFGFGIHPWFVYQGKRGQTRLTVPATDLMEAVELLPTGKLVPLESTKYDLRSGGSLEGFVIDDVYFGMKPNAPARIDFSEAGLRITLQATEDFTHMVVYTPEEPHFCVENQTCSTDAHNLHGKGLKKEAHLRIVPPGEKQSGAVEFQFETIGRR